MDFCQEVKKKPFSCEHNRAKNQCMRCKGKHICSHSRRKTLCKDCNPWSYFVNIQRTYIRDITRFPNRKSRSDIPLLGCDREYFLRFQQSKLPEGETLEGKQWDHIKPSSAFKDRTDGELLKCCHYSNFQPLSPAENLKKGRKWSADDDTFWNENICGKAYNQIYIP